LDELPQFFNIMLGDMNLVGPRPHPVSNFELFSEHIPYYWLRAKVRPGITGWAQVRYRYANNLDEEIEKMRYDLYYIKHLSISFDLRILFDTVKTVLFGSQSVDSTERPVAPGAANRISHVASQPPFEATTDVAVLERTHVVIICVPTPLRKSKDPDISYIVAAGSEVAARYHPGQLVVLESTTYPETTEELLLPIFRQRGATVGEDF